MVLASTALALATPPVLEESPALLVLVEIDIAVRVDPDGVPTITRTGCGRAEPARQHLPIEVQESDQAVQFRHIHYPSLIDIDVAGAGQVAPLGQKVALGGKDLDAVVLPIGHQHAAIGMHPDPMWHVEFARRTLSRCTP